MSGRNHKMTMAQFLEMQRIRERCLGGKRAKYLKNILVHAQVTNPIIVSKEEKD